MGLHVTTIGGGPGYPDPGIGTHFNSHGPTFQAIVVVRIAFVPPIPIESLERYYPGTSR